jgi:hypothetical protein
MRFSVHTRRKEAKNADLEEKLSAAENRDGSRFDLVKDTLDDIADTIIRAVGEGRAKGLVAALNKRLRKSKPAG